MKILILLISLVSLMIGLGSTTTSEESTFEQKVIENSVPDHIISDRNEIRDIGFPGSGNTE